MTLDELDDKIEEWHKSDTSLTLYEFLGWTKDEYRVWLEKGIMPE